MAAGQDLIDFRENLKNTRDNLREVESDVSNVEDAVMRARQALEYVETIEDNAKSFSKQVDSMLLTVKMMGQAGPFKLVAKVAKSVLEQVKKVADKLEVKAASLNQKIEDGEYIEKLEAAEDKLDDIQDKLETAADKVDEYADATDDLIDAFDTIDEIDGPNDTLGGLSSAVDSFVSGLNTPLEAINTTYTDVRDEIDAFQTGFNTFALNSLMSVASKFKTVASSLAFLDGPLSVVYTLLKPIEPVLNAVGFVFKVTVEPVLDYILEKTGINDLLDKVANKISSALPDPNVLNGLESKIEDMFADFGDLGDAFSTDAWTDDLEDLFEGQLNGVLDLFDDDQDNKVTIGTAADDHLVGTSGADVLNGREGDDTVTGNAGNDLIFASAGDDTIYGGDGNKDRMRFKEDFSEFTFYQDGENGPLVFVHESPTNRFSSQGTEIVTGVEQFIFKNESFTLSDLIENVQTGNGPTMDGGNGNDFLYGGTSSITISGKDGKDRITGSDQDDTLLGGKGNDVIIAKEGSDSINGGKGSDTWVFADLSSPNRTTTVDLALNFINDGNGDDVIKNIENVIMRATHEAVFRGNSKDNIFTSTKRDDYLDGKAGDDQLFAGDGRDVLAGGIGQDSVFGGDGADDMIAGGQVIDGKGDFYDGGDDYDGVIYSRDFSFYQVEYGINDRAPDDQGETNSVRVYADKGRVDRLNGSGTKVQAKDRVENVELFVGSDGVDTLWGGIEDDYRITIDGGGGDDILYSNGSGGIFGGKGDDLMFVTVNKDQRGGMAFDGSFGRDTVDGRSLDNVRFLLKDSGIGAAQFSGYDASESNDFDVENTNPFQATSQVFGGSITGTEVLYLGNFADEVQLAGRDELTIYGLGGDDVLIRDRGTSSTAATLYGGGGDDYLRMKDKGDLYGGNGRDYFELNSGGSGNDMSIFGGNGDDTMSVRRFNGPLDGGDGYDRLVFDISTHSQAPNRIIVDLTNETIVADGGIDDIEADVTGFEEIVGAEFKTDEIYGGSEAERFVTRGGNDTVHGNGGDDQIFAGVGVDTVYGGNGDDLIHGGGGSDRIFGGDGKDTLSFATAAPDLADGSIVADNFGSVTVDLQLGTVVGAHGSDILDSIENIIGGVGDDTVYGSSENNVLSGGRGNDLLFGEAGNDVLNGGDGDDGLYGGVGKDRFVMGAGNDTVVGGSEDDVLIFGSTIKRAVIDFRTLEATTWVQNTEAVWNDTGTSEARLYDGVMLTPDDVRRAQPEFAESASDLSISLPEASDPEASMFAIKTVNDGNTVGRVTFSQIEKIVGGEGELRLDFSRVLDTFIFDGSKGTKDILDLTNFTSGVQYNLSNGSTNQEDLENHTLAGIDIVDGSSKADQISGDGAANTLNGFDGSDVLKGQEGRDVLKGGTGGDSLFGGVGDDDLFGGKGADLIKGGAGKDMLDGGAGKDLLFGGDQKDIFVFGSKSDVDKGSSADTIADFGNGSDKIDLSDMVSGFSFIGSDGFSGDGREIRATVSDGSTQIRIDFNGDGSTDGVIILDGFTGLKENDFIL